MDIINNLVDSMKDSLVSDTAEIVKIKSVKGEAKPNMPYGEGVNKSLECALDISQRLGFRTVNVDGYMGYAEYGQGEEMVAVLGHLDVVPEGEGWAYPPYGGEVHDGKVYGRGTMDDKGPIIAALYGLKAIKEANLPLKRRVRILFGTNEENGCTEVPYYLERDEAPVMGFTPDGMYPIIYAEKGILFVKVNKEFKSKSRGNIVIKCITGGTAANVVPDTCVAVLEIKNDTSDVISKIQNYIEKTGYAIDYKLDGSTLKLISHGVPAHGSLPHLGKNAIMQLFMTLSTLDIDGDVKEYIDFFSKYVKDETRGESLGIYLKDEMGELSFNVGVISLDEDRVSLSINIRYPVTFKTSDVMDSFTKQVNSIGASVETVLEQHPLYFPKDHELIKILSKVYKEQTGLEVELLAIGGGTYAKEMPNTVAFGPLFPGKPDYVHQANEYMEIDDLVLNAKIYGNAIYEMAK